MIKHACKCGNECKGDTLYRCKACGREGCSDCANPEGEDGEWELSTCYCGADVDDFGKTLFTVVGHLGEDDYEGDEIDDSCEDPSESEEDEDEQEDQEDDDSGDDA